MAEHPIRNPIRSSLESIAKYTVSAGRIRQQWLYRLFIIYTCSNEIIAALAGIGIGYPLLTTAAAGAGSPQPAGVPVLSVGLVLAIMWVLLKVSVTHDDGLKRATLMKSCMKEMLIQRSRVDREALVQADPEAKLQDIFDKLGAIYDRHSQESSWPWLGGFAPGIDNVVENEVKTWFTSWQNSHGTAAIVAEENLRRE